MTDAAHPLDRLSHWLMLVINGLKEMVAAQGPKSRPLVPLVVSAWFRLNRIIQEFAQLTALMREGRLPATRARRATTARAELGRRKRAGTAPAPDPAPAPVGLPRARLPNTHAWLIRLAPQTAQLRGQVETWLRDPEVWAVLEGSARARRIVRPLCRMLGIRPALQLGAAHPLALRRSPARTEAPSTEGGPDEPAGAEPAGAGEGARPRRRPRKSRAASAPRPPGIRELEWPREPDWADGFT